MATQTISHTESAATVPITAQALPERLAPQSQPVEEPEVSSAEDTAPSKPKVRRAIDEEGGTTTASVSWQTLTQLLQSRY